MLAETKAVTMRRLLELLPDKEPRRYLYDLMPAYPSRSGKGLRPALCIATCRAFGGSLDDVLDTAVAVELFHNAFLIHDDVEDGSELRRKERTLHRIHGVPIAVNVGDGMLAAAMEPLLENVELIGLGRALRILQIVARMARESAEGQMIELDWVRATDWAPSDRSYVRMIYKKTCWYTFLAPVLVGTTAAGGELETARAFARFATPLGIAFQIQDDALNLTGDVDRYGKEIDGDLWEGKHTLILIEAVRRASKADRERALAILSKARTGFVPKSADDVGFLRVLIERAGALDYARATARRHAARAARSFDELARTMPRSAHREFLAQLVSFVVERDC